MELIYLRKVSVLVSANDRSRLPDRTVKRTSGDKRSTERLVFVDGDRFFLRDTPFSRAQQMTNKEPAPPRYLVREACKGWMVYDRQRKGPAMVGTSPAVNLTRERASYIAHSLAAELQDKSNYPSRPQ